MKSDKINVVNSWFKKAENDLRNSEHVVTMENPACDTVCFRAKQCAEKYLTGFLSYYEIEFPKMHSLEDLLGKCRNIEPGIESELKDIEILSSYGVAVRYPDDIYYDIPLEDALEAISLAKKS